MNVNEHPPLGPDEMGSPASLRSRHLYRNARREPVLAAPLPLNPGAPVIYARHRKRTPLIEHVLSAVGIFLVLLFVGWLALMVATEESIPPGNQPAAVAPSPSAEVPPCTDYHAERGMICQGPLLPECVTEDSDNCYWDGDLRGNRSGQSFYTLNDQTVLLP